MTTKPRVGETTYFTYEQVARKLDVSVRTVQRLVATGELRAVAVTSKIRRVTEAELAAFNAGPGRRYRRGAA